MQVMKPAVILFPFVILCLVSADVLQNPDFELPPSKLAPNSTVQRVPLNENNTIPGWTAQGTVELYYLNSSLLGNQHQAILLAEDGKINQTFIANGNLKDYLLTFTLTLGSPSPGPLKCSDNISLVISAPDRDSEFFMKPNYEKEQLNIYGIHLGSWGNEEPIGLFILSKNTDPPSNSTCWPLVDNLTLKTLDQSSQTNGSLLPNGGFELGPAFMNGSSTGVLLDQEPSIIGSALNGWSIIGTIRYIDSKNYFVPEGHAAIELTSGGGEIAGVDTAVTLKEGSSYELEFMMGDANDSCTGLLVVGVQTGQTSRNITFQSNGTGSANNYSVTFKAGSSPNSISFQSYEAKQTADGIFCGPVVDAVVLRASDGYMTNSLNKFTFVALLLLTFLQQFFNLFST